MTMPCFQMRCLRGRRLVMPWCLLSFLCGIAWGSWQVTIPSAQSLDVERRLNALEEIKTDKRLAVLESRLDSLETVGRGTLMAVVTQLLLSGIEIRRRRNGSEKVTSIIEQP